MRFANFKEIVAEQGRTVILTTHDMNVVQDTCDGDYCQSGSGCGR